MTVEKINCQSRRDFLKTVGLLPVFEGRQREPHDVLSWEHVGNRAVRKGDWKLLSTREGQCELYDIKADRTELHDFSKDKPEKFKEVESLYHAWAKHCGVLPWSEVQERLKALRK